MKSTCRLDAQLRLFRLSAFACALVLAASVAWAQDDAGAGWSRSFGALEFRGGVDTYTAY